MGDKVIFEDQIHYTIVKNTTFNGIKLPDLLLLKENGELVTVREFGFEEYERRNWIYRQILILSLIFGLCLANLTVHKFC